MIASILMSLASVGFFAASDGVTTELVDDSFSSPLYVTAPQGDDRLFVVERGGAVKVVVDDQVVGTYFNVSSLLPESAGPEQGLLGLAFHPEFADNGRLFISYTDSAGDLVVAGLTVDPAASSIGLGTLQTVIEIDHPPARNHNGGMILFGPDGLLYFGTGDGGGSGDPQGNGQNINTLLGKILRLDVDSDDFPGEAERNYSIPGENPFVGGAGADEIYVYGLRNPWRFWIDPPTGRLYIGDVGQDSREEVTILEPGSAGGSNLGWDRLEGRNCYPPGASCSTAGTVLPQVDYAHGSGASVTGGVVYRGTDIPQIQGTYFYGDFIQGWVRSFRYDGTISNHITRSFGTSLVSSFGVDGKGEMYIVSLGGSIWRLKAPDNDEMFFYRDDGLFRFYDIKPNGDLGTPILAGSGYTPDWDSIADVNLDGDTNDEMFFYRNDGLFRYYNVGANGSLGSPILAGSGYTTGWSSISAVDLDGDGQDEMFFYRDDGLFRYYNITPNGSLGTPILAGSGYTTGWSSISAVDLDGDGQDEMFFYRNDGLFRYYNINPNGSLGTPILAGSGYTTGWSSISAVDLDGDGQDEMFFYRDDGLFRYYNINPNGSLGTPILAGSGYTTGWTSITAVDMN